MLDIQKDLVLRLTPLESPRSESAVDSDGASFDSPR